MAIPILVNVRESISDLKSLYGKAPIHLRPRYKMLLLIIGGQTNSQELAAKTGVSRNTIANWKNSYREGGIERLTTDLRGGDFKSNISAHDLKTIELRLSDPTKAFTSFAQARAWLKEELGIEKNYHAVNKYFTRNFGGKLKVGRKTT